MARALIGPLQGMGRLAILQLSGGALQLSFSDARGQELRRMRLTDERPGSIGRTGR